MHQLNTYSGPGTEPCGKKPLVSTPPHPSQAVRLPHQLSSHLIHTDVGSLIYEKPYISSKRFRQADLARGREAGGFSER
jgi:hypothetical protein